MEVTKYQELKNQLATYCQKINLSGEVNFILTWFGDRLGKLNEADFKSVINRVIAEVCLLNGLETYDSEKQNEMYVAQMRVIAKFIFEGFGFITPAELLNAFHLNLQGKYPETYHQFKDKKINCEFIGQVLSAYKNYKQNFVNLNPDLVLILNPPEQPKKLEYKPDIVNDERVMILREFHKFKTDPEWNPYLLLDCVYERLVADEFIPANGFEKFVKKASIRLLREKQLSKNIPSSLDKIRKTMEDGSIGYVLQKNFDMNKFIDSELHQIRNGSSYEVNRLAKQLAVISYFTFCLKKNLPIYVKESPKK